MLTQNINRTKLVLLKKTTLNLKHTKSIYEFKFHTTPFETPQIRHKSKISIYTYRPADASARWSPAPSSGWTLRRGAGPSAQSPTPTRPSTSRSRSTDPWWPWPWIYFQNSIRSLSEIYIYIHVLIKSPAIRTTASCLWWNVAATRKTSWQDND